MDSQVNQDNHVLFLSYSADGMYSLLPRVSTPIHILGPGVSPHATLHVYLYICKDNCLPEWPSIFVSLFSRYHVLPAVWSINDNSPQFHWSIATHFTELISDCQAVNDSPICLRVNQLIVESFQWQFWNLASQQVLFLKHTFNFDVNKLLPMSPT